MLWSGCHVYFSCPLVSFASHELSCPLPLLPNPHLRPSHAWGLLSMALGWAQNWPQWTAASHTEESVSVVSVLVSLSVSWGCLQMDTSSSVQPIFREQGAQYFIELYSCSVLKWPLRKFLPKITICFLKHSTSCYLDRYSSSYKMNCIA